MAKVTPITRTDQARRGRGGEPGRPTSERRSSPRLSAAEAPPFVAQLVDGPGIEVVNVSQTGILTRSEARLMPGSMIGLRILTADDSFVLFGRVVRSRLLNIDEGAAKYESALALSQEFPLLAASSSSPALAVASPDATSRRSGDYPVELGRLSGAPIVLTVTAFVDQSREDVLKAFSQNRQTR